MIKPLKAAQQDSNYTGNLRVNVTSILGLLPVRGATVTISNSDTPADIIEQITTDESGQTPEISLPAPNLAYSMEPSEPRPYTDYNIEITAPGFEPVRIVGSEILPDENSIQNVSMIPLATAEGQEEDINIPDHTLYGEYPPGSLTAKY